MGQWRILVPFPNVTEHCSRYEDNLSNELPRIPAVKSASGFRASSAASRGTELRHLYSRCAPR